MKNPYRYRGYYYDAETGLYYLQSRYYDPEMKRFFNADELITTGQGVLSNNMFAYCKNNPINSIDSTGRIAAEVILAAFIELLFYLTIMTVLTYLIIATVNTDDVATLVVEYVERIKNAKDKILPKDNCVYVLVDPDNNDLVKYVGRTNDPARRKDEHRHDPKHPERSNYNLIVIKSGMDIVTARLFEQVCISAYSLSYLDNARREIAIGKVSGYNKYIEAVVEIIDGATEDGIQQLIRR